MTDLADEPEEVLAHRVRGGDTRAFEVLFNRHYTSLTSFAYSITRNTDSASDVVGDVFLSLWRARAQWNPGAGVRAYLFAAVRNRSLNARRGERRATLLQLRVWQDASETDTWESSGPVEEDERHQGVRRAIATLPEKRRAVLMLRWYHQMEVSEISHVLEMSENAVRMHLSKGVRMIRTFLAGHS